MQTLLRSPFLLLALSLCLAACTDRINLGQNDGGTSNGGDPPFVDPQDDGGSAADGGVGPDGGTLDSGVTDGGVTDGGVTDGGVTDGGVTDGGVTDGGLPDGGALAEVPVFDGGWYAPRQGLFGGEIRLAARAPSQSNVIYVGTPSRGVFKSVDHGANWAETALNFGSVTALTVDLVDQTTAWAATIEGEESNIWRTTNGGATWTMLVAPTGYIHSLSVSAGGLWALGKSFQSSPQPSEIFWSGNGGSAWTPIASPVLPTNDGLVAIVAHPSSPSTAWLCSSLRVWRTVDGGASWSNVTPALPSPSSSYFKSLEVSPTRPNQLVLSVQGASCYRSDDGALSWTAMDARTVGRICTAAIDEPDVVFAVPLFAGSPAWRSLDRGLTFTQVNLPAAATVSVDGRVASAATRDVTLIAGQGTEGHTSVNGGLSWARSAEGLSAVQVDSVAASADGSLLLVGSRLGDVFRSTDQGRTWARTRLQSSQSEKQVVGLAISRQGRVYAATKTNELWVSLDDGLSFSLATTNLPLSGALLVTPSGELILGGAVFSTDEGQTWSDIGTDEVTDVSSVPGSAAIARLTSPRTSGGVQVSQSPLGPWQAIADPMGVTGIFSSHAVSSRIDPFVFYMAVEDSGDVGFARYGGTTWARAELNFFPPSFGVMGRMRRLVVGALNGADFILGASSRCLHLSRDGAATWSPIPTPGFDEVNDLAIAQDQASLAIVGTSGRWPVLVTRTAGQ